MEINKYKLKEQIQKLQAERQQISNEQFRYECQFGSNMVDQLGYKISDKYNKRLNSLDLKIEQLEIVYNCLE